MPATHLVADIEKLREHLHIERWMVFGGSWGTTLALAYAEAYPKRVTQMVLNGVATTRPSEIEWLYHGMAPMFPEQWHRFRQGAPENERDGDLVAVYYRLLQHPDAEVRLQAARDWHDWENASLSVDPNYQPHASRLEPNFLLARARIVTHYFYHNAWLEDGILMKNAHRLAGIPGILVQGRLDLGSPMMTAWELSKGWPDSDLVIVYGAGHSTSDTGISEAIIAATDRFATQ